MLQPEKLRSALGSWKKLNVGMAQLQGFAAFCMCTSEIIFNDS